MLKARVTFRVMKLGRYVTVDDGGNYVTERSHKDKKIIIIIIIITPHKESLGRLWCCKNESQLSTFKNPSLGQMKVNFIIKQNERRLPFFTVAAIEVNDIKM